MILTMLMYIIYNEHKLEDSVKRVNSIIILHLKRKGVNIRGLSFHIISPFLLLKICHFLTLESKNK